MKTKIAFPAVLDLREITSMQLIPFSGRIYQISQMSKTWESPKHQKIVQQIDLIVKICFVLYNYRTLILLKPKAKYIIIRKKLKIPRKPNWIVRITDRIITRTVRGNFSLKYRNIHVSLNKYFSNYKIHWGHNSWKL